MRKLFIYGLWLINLYIILYFWWSGNSSSFSNIVDAITALGRLFGFLAAYSALLQFMLMGRARWLEEVFGLDKLAQLHKKNGYLALTCIVLHPIFIILGYSMSSNTSFIEQFLQLVTATEILQAFISVCLFTLIVFFSIYIVRRKLKYETWYFIHLFTYLAIVLGFAHQLTYGQDLLLNDVFRYYWWALYIFVAVNHVIYRFARQVYLYYKYRFVVDHVIKETDEAASVYITGKNLNTFSIQAGQFFSVRFLNKTMGSQAHPFSLSSFPVDKYIRITPKNVGDFTSQIPQLKKSTPVILDGPFGVFTSKHANKNKFLFIAGGIGITPIMAMIQELQDKAEEIVLICTNKTVNEIVFKKDLDVLGMKKNIRIHHLITQDPKFKGEKGRLDKEKINRLVPQVQEYEIYMCGPVPMMEAVKQCLKEMKVPHNQIHYETFKL